MRLERRHESGEIAERVAAVAAAIDHELPQRPLILLSILKGSAFFLADLARKMTGPFSVEFMHVRREEGANDVLQIDFKTGFAVRGRHVLMLKDVVNTGVIETYLGDQLRGEGAASVRIAAIVDKPRERKAAVTVDFALFAAETGGMYAGYGMEYHGLHGHLPDIYEVVEQ